MLQPYIESAVFLFVFLGVFAKRNEVRLIYQINPLNTTPAKD